MQPIFNEEYAIEYIPEKGIKVYARGNTRQSLYVEIKPDYLLREKIRKVIKFL